MGIGFQRLFAVLPCCPTHQPKYHPHELPAGGGGKGRKKERRWQRKKAGRREGDGKGRGGEPRRRQSEKAGRGPEGAVPAPADPALSHFAGATTVSAMSGEPRWGSGSAQCRHATGCCSCVCVCPSTRQQRHTWATVRDVDRPPQKLDGESKATR